MKIFFGFLGKFFDVHILNISEFGILRFTLFQRTGKEI